MEYKNVVVYNDKDEKFIKAIVETNFGKIEVTDVDKFNKLMTEFANQEKVTLDTLLKNEKLITKIVEKEDKKETTSSVILTEEEIDKIINGSSSKDKKIKKEKSKKKTGIVKKLLCSVGVLVLLATGSYHLDKHNNTFNGKVIKFHKRVVEFFTPAKDVNDKDVVINQNGVVVTTNKDFTIVDSGEKNKSEYDKNMEAVVNRQDKTDEVISKLDEKVVNMTKEEILTAINDNARIANSSLFEVSQFINDKKLTGKAYYYNFEKNFSNGSYDYNTIKVLSDLRNSVLKSVFEEKDAQKAKSLIRDFYSLYAEVVTLDKKCSYNGLVLDFSEMSDIGKATVLELGVAMLEIYLPNYEYEVDGKKLNKEKILEDAVETLEEDLIPTLIDKGYRK